MGGEIGEMCERGHNGVDGSDGSGLNLMIRQCYFLENGHYDISLLLIITIIIIICHHHHLVHTSIDHHTRAPRSHEPAAIRHLIVVAVEARRVALPPEAFIHVTIITYLSI